MNAALFMRVSTDRQDETNQLPELERFCAHHGLTVVKTYTVHDSAWKPGAEYKKALQTALDDAWAGQYTHLVVWAADRLTRGGVEDLLRLIREFSARNACSC